MSLLHRERSDFDSFVGNIGSYREGRNRRMVGKAAYEFVVDGYALLIGCVFAGSLDISVRQYFGTYHDPVDEG